MCFLSEFVSFLKAIVWLEIISDKMYQKLESSSKMSSWWLIKKSFKYISFLLKCYNCKKISDKFFRHLIWFFLKVRRFWRPFALKLGYLSFWCNLFWWFQLVSTTLISNTVFKQICHFDKNNAIIYPLKPNQPNTCEIQSI